MNMKEMRQRLAIEKLEYRKPISITNQFFDFVMNMRPQAAIRISPKFPTGWIAEVPAEDKVWTVECERGEMRVTKVADLIGHTPNFQYIKAGEEDISKYEKYFLPENYYGGEKMLPVTCDLFCNEDEAACRFCPYGKRD